MENATADTPKNFVYDPLKRYLDARTDDQPYLFTAGKGRMPTVTARFYLRAHTKKLGIKKHIKNHIFRKSFVTHLIEKGADGIIEYPLNKVVNRSDAL